MKKHEETKCQTFLFFSFGPGRFLAEGVRDENGKMKENHRNDWICMNTTSNEGRKCEARNWQRNEDCHDCKGKKARDAPQVKDRMGKVNDPSEQGRGSYNGKVCAKYMSNKGPKFGVTGREGKK